MKHFVYGGGLESRGEVLAARKDSTFGISFGDAGKVTVRFKKLGKSTQVELTQENIPTTPMGRVEFHLGYLTGCTFFLTNMKSVLESGNDLREDDMKRATQKFLVNM